MSKTETVTLEYPFEFNGETYTELTIRRPKLRDLKKSESVKGNMAKGTMMLADLAEIDPKAIEEMDMEDFKTCSMVIADFMGVSEEDIQKRFGQ
jgi:uncharacterized protein (DUF885 family)